MANFTKHISSSNKKDYLLSNLDVKINDIDSFLAVDSSGNIIGDFPIVYNRNNIYRGKDLTSIYSIDEIYNRTIDGTFKDLYIGDYITVGKYKIAIAGFNIYSKTGPVDLNNHIVFIIESGIPDSHMNPTNTSEGGYYGSYMNKTYLPKIYSEINPLLKNHIITHKELMSNSMNPNFIPSGNPNWKGATTDWEWYDTNLILCSEVEVYGSTVWSSSGYDIGIAKVQLPYFRLNERNINIGSSWWLSAVPYAYGFCYCGWYGDADAYNASSVLRVRPRFLFGKQS